MPRQTTVDFTGAPPAQGSVGPDYVHPGKYGFAVELVDETTSKNSGKKMYVANIALATKEGVKKLVDRFVMDTDPGKQPYGKQRFHAFLLALGLPVQERQMSFDLDRLTGLRGIVEVVDEQQAATEQYAARVTSRPVGYYPLTAATPAAAPAPAAAAAPAPAPAAVAAPVAPPAAPAAPPPSAEQVAAQVDDLFG